MAIPTPAPSPLLELVRTIEYCNEKVGIERLLCSDWFLPAVGMVLAIIWMVRNYAEECRVLGVTKAQTLFGNIFFPFVLLAQYIIMMCLSSMAKRGLETQILKIKPDPFQISGTKDNHMFGQNWSYDYVIAFAVTNEDEGKSKNQFHKYLSALNAILLIIYFMQLIWTDSDDESRDDHFIREHSFAAVIAKLKKAKLETKCFFSRDRSVVFVKIRASLERLCRQANTVGYQLSLDEGRVRQRLCEGHFNSARKRYRWAPKAYPHEVMAKAENDDWAKDNYFRGDGIKDYHEFMLVRDGSREAERMAEKDRKVVGRIYPIQDDFNLCKWKYWQHHFAAYTDKHAFEGLFKRDVQGTFSPFRGVDRLKLIKSILESDKGGCCHLRIGKLLKKVTNKRLSSLNYHVTELSIRGI